MKVRIGILAMTVFVVATGCKHQSEEARKNKEAIDILESERSADPESSAANQREMEVEAKSDEVSCFEKSTFTLPYNQRIDPTTAIYQTIACEIDGTEEFRCEHQGIRYIPMPDYKDIRVILVPMDCGDFDYRYFLLTILDKKVVSSEYVEGKWFEPDSESTAETTHFSIDESYQITVITHISENGVETNVRKKVLALQPNGTLKTIR